MKTTNTGCWLNLLRAKGGEAVEATAIRAMWLGCDAILHSERIFHVGLDIQEARAEQYPVVPKTTLSDGGVES